MILRSLTRRVLDYVERQVGGVSVDYLRYVADHSMAVFAKFMLFMPLAAHHKKLPMDAATVARIVATRDEDCGPCLQIVVNTALQEDVDPAILEAAIADRLDDLDPLLADVHRFTQAIVDKTWDEDALRERLRAAYGEQGLIELAMAIASTRVFPITKRVLGYGQTCQNVEIDFGGTQV